MIMFFGDLAFIFLLSIPPFFIYLQSRRLKEFERFTLFLFLVNFGLVKMMMDFGDSFWTVFFWQFLIIYPACIALFVYFLTGDKQKGRPIIARKHLVLVTSLVIICSIVVNLNLNYNRQTVQVIHNQLIQELIESENPHEYLLVHSNHPRTLLILEDLDEIKDGDIKVTTLPWKTVVKVSYKKMNASMTQEFTYVRFYNSWKLDGIYDSSEVKR